MRYAVLMTLFSLSNLSFAGDGGFDLYTCISSSGRTNLTVYQDFYSGSEVPNKVVFGIDGQFVTYAPEVGKCTNVKGEEVESDCVSVQIETRGSRTYVFVGEGSKNLLQIDITDGKSATIGSGFFDPRPRFFDVFTKGIQSNCKHFEMEP